MAKDYKNIDWEKVKALKDKKDSIIYLGNTLQIIDLATTISFMQDANQEIADELGVVLTP
jgi:hypothetical protein